MSPTVIALLANTLDIDTEVYLQLADVDTDIPTLPLMCGSLDTTTDAWREGITLLLEVMAQDSEPTFMEYEDDAWGWQR